MTEWGRRAVLRRSGSLAALTGLAGCLGTGDRSSEPELVTSFYTLAEFTRAVVGDTYTVTNAVPAGEHGHGWEPSANLLPDILESEGFVYLDADGFQPWAESAAAELADEYADEVALIDALDGIELLAYESDHHETVAHNPDELGEVAELEVLEPGSRSILANYHFDHWHGTIPPVPPGRDRTLAVRFVDGQGEQFPLGADSELRVTASSDDERVVGVESLGDRVRLAGRDPGTTTMRFELERAGTVTWETEPIRVTVDEAEADDQANRDHGRYDVKFFSDPVLAQDGVLAIRDALIELDPDSEESFRANAADYVERLDALHTEFRAALADREHDFVVLAGHDSFNYLGTRYGFEIHTPVGLSPDDQPSSRDVAAAVDLVEEHDIEYVLYDAFDGDRTARTIVAEADAASEAVAVSAAESYLAEWEIAGYHDYIGQMREINLPAFRRALGAGEE